MSPFSICGTCTKPKLLFKIAKKLHAQINKIVPGGCVCVWGLSVCQWGGGLFLVILLWELNKCEFTEEGGGGRRGPGSLDL